MTQITVSIAVSADDAHLRTPGSATYPDGGAVTVDTTDPNPWIVKQFFSSNYRTSIALVRFNTASIPDDATVTSATLRMDIAAGFLNPDSRNLNFEWYSWTAAATGDFIETPATTGNATAISSLAAGVNNFVLSNPDANVSKTGYTGLRFGISGGAPTGVNEMYVRAIEHATIEEPRLIVDYTEFQGTSSIAWTVA